MTEPIVNNLTIQAATVNGSGSQTANLVLTRAIFHMGIPVAPKNVFPSNIEGLPTWYQLRVTPQGHMARRDQEVDARADLYALGLLLNELFTGAVPQGSGYATIGQNFPDL